MQFGNSPSSKIYWDENSGKSFVVTLFSNTICQSGFGFNNDQNDKCHTQSNPSFRTMLNLETLMGYFYGLLDDLRQNIMLEQLADGCDPNLLSAKIYGGFHPFGVIRAKEGKQILHVVSNRPLF